MLVAYIDGSHNEDIEVVSGFVASELAWQTFDRHFSRNTTSRSAFTQRSIGLVAAPTTS